MKFNNFFIYPLKTNPSKVHIISEKKKFQMSKKKQEDIQDEIFQEIAEEVSEITDEQLTNANEEMKQFFEESEMSPKKFRYNLFSSANGDGFTGQLHYTLDDGYEDLPGYALLHISSAALKACPYPITEISPENNNKYSQDVALFIYGHPMDADDEFSSRIDRDFLWKIHPEIMTKFCFVRITGAFENIPEMKQILFDLYNRLTTKKREAHIELTVDSRVRDDDGNFRTIANLVHSGYLKPGILDNPMLVTLCYQTLSPRQYARLFTKKLVIEHAGLFDEDEDADEDDSTGGYKVETMNIPF